MRLLHFSAEDGRLEGVWFTDEDDTGKNIAEELTTDFGIKWSLDWEIQVDDMCPATERLYEKQ